MTKRALSALAAILAMAICLSAVGLAAYADEGEEGIYTGICGDDLTWEFNSWSGELFIYGSGEMYDYSPESPAPWDEFRTEIVDVCMLGSQTTSIGNYAFYGCVNLIDFDTCETLRRVGDYALYNCSFKDFLTPKAFEYIGDYAFCGCAKLDGMEIHRNVSHIGKCAFLNCSLLRGFLVDRENPYFCNYTVCLFDKDMTTLICCPSGPHFLFDFYLPTTVKTIADEALSGCSMIRNVVLPYGLEKIGDHAFRGTSIESITIPGSVTEIGVGALSECSSLISADLGKNVAVLSESLFEGDASLETLAVRGRALSIEKSCFEGCASLDTIHFGGTREEWNACAIDGLSGFNADNVALYYHGDGEHFWGEWKYITEPSYFVDGMIAHNCLFCDKAETVTVERYANPFTDVPERTWYYEAALYCKFKGYMSGMTETTFEPKTTVSRAMVVTVLWRMAGSPNTIYDYDFYIYWNDWYSDVPRSKWYTRAVMWAKEQGIATGVSADMFDPDAGVTREQLALMFMRFSEKVLRADVSERQSDLLYLDTNNISGWARDAVEWAVAKGLISGVSLYRLDPRGTATRAQLAQIIYKFTNKPDKTENERSNNALSEKWGFTLQFYALADHRSFDGGGFSEESRCWMAVYPIVNDGGELPEITMYADVSCILGTSYNIPFIREISDDGTVWFHADNKRLYESNYINLNPRADNDPLKVDLTVMVGSEIMTVTYYVDVDYRY